MKAVFLDTSALLPLLDRSDRDHPAVKAALEALIAQGALLVTSSYTLVEAAALTRHRLGLAAFAALGAALDRSAEILWVDEDLHRRAWAMAAKQTRKGPGLVDWVSFLAMREHGIDTALALDRHFRQQGFTTLP
jgi:predicted nucleic acid-binding protein